MRSLLIVFLWTSITFGTECKNRDYIIEIGDSLTEISQKMYGESGFWSIIFEQNRDTIESPYEIRAGKTIEIPCIENKTPKKSISEEKPLEKEPTITQKRVKRPIKEIKDVEIVSTSRLYPFRIESSSHRDMLTDIVKALFDNLSEVSYSIDYIENSSIHPTLLKNNKYDISLGWYRPNCSKKECQLIYSKPLFQAITALYRRKGSNEEIQSPKDIYGKKICRPKGWFTFDLEEQGLIDGKTMTLISKKTPTQCFSSLKDGKVDFVSLTSFVGDATLQKMGLSRYIESVKSISTIVDLTVVAHKNGKNARAYINKFNQGLEKLDKSGKLEAIQSKYLKEFYDNIKN